MTSEEQDAELARLRALILQLAERLAAASEVLGHLAERRDKHNLEALRSAGSSCNEETR
jgi:hypothetical protein